MKAQGVSYRDLNLMLGYKTMSYAWEFVNNDKPVPEKALSYFAIRTGLTMDEFHYLRAMTSYNQTKDANRKKFYREIMNIIRQTQT